MCLMVSIISKREKFMNIIIYNKRTTAQYKENLQLLWRQRLRPLPFLVLFYLLHVVLTLHLPRGGVPPPSDNRRGGVIPPFSHCALYCVLGNIEYLTCVCVCVCVCVCECVCVCVSVCDE